MSNLTLFTNDIKATTGYREATLEEIMTAARYARNRKVRGTGLTSPRVTADYLIARLAELPHEVFTLIYLDNHCRFIAAQDLFRGTIKRGGLPSRGREGGAQTQRRQSDPGPYTSVRNRQPSKADEYITDRLKQALSLVDIKVLDHIIIAGGETTSFAEKGLI